MRGKWKEGQLKGWGEGKEREDGRGVRRGVRRGGKDGKGEDGG